jgi:hypothetical protein
LFVIAKQLKPSN